MRLVILGAGAIGGVVGGLLASAGRDVVLIARGAQLAALRDRGLRLERPEGALEVRPPVTAAGDPFAWRPGDLLVLAVKTQDAAAALRELAPPPEVPIACFTNGVEAERLALRHARAVIGAYVMLPATYLTPGVVQVASATIPGVLDLGRYPDGHGEVTDELAGELIVAGFACEVRPQIMKWKRAKLLSNLGNAVEALCGAAGRGGELDAAARAEGQACFAAAGLSWIPAAEEASRRAVLDLRPVAGQPRAGGSTWQSLARGGTVESDYLNGEIAMLGRLHGVPTPINEALQRLAADAARAHRPPGAWSLAELAAAITGR
jgi:2-dehydropantoate 2-reductase